MNVLGYVFIMACLLQTQMNPGLYLEKYSMSVVLLLQFTAYNTETAYKTEKGSGNPLACHYRVLPTLYKIPVKLPVSNH